MTALTTAMGLLFYGITFPGRYLGLAVTIVVGAFCFSALGVAVSTFVPNEEAAAPIINFLLLPLLFISGTFYPVPNGSTLAHIAGIFPVRPLIQLMEAVFNPHTGGTGVAGAHVALLLLWGTIGIVLSLLRFRWEPRHS